MKKALAFTTYNRIDYLSHTLISWQKVSDLNSWDIHFYVEPSDCLLYTSPSPRD